MSALAVAGLAAAAGGGVTFVVARRLLSSPPRPLVRVNVDGARVPAVLGPALVAGGLVGLVVATVADPDVASDLEASDLVPAAGAVLLGLAAAGLWDDLRGDERPRGFSGHLGALRGGRVTGGLVKLAAGGATGLFAGAVVATDGWTIVMTGALVALSANLINLFDRAPGRAGKVVVAAVPLALAAGSVDWLLVAAGSLGGLAAVTPADLSARGMLGDTGANPLGGLVGLGLAGGPRPAQVAALVVLLAANLASERVSFGAVIHRTPWLRNLDLWGRKRP